jgi:hypothetical protein
VLVVVADIPAWVWQHPITFIVGVFVGVRLARRWWNTRHSYLRDPTPQDRQALEKWLEGRGRARDHNHERGG